MTFGTALRAAAQAASLAIFLAASPPALSGQSPTSPPSPRRADDERVEFEWPAMGTRVRFVVRGPGAEIDGPGMRDAAAAAIEEGEAATSAFRPESDLARVSAAAGSGEWISVGQPFVETLELALAVAKESGGAFNPLVAPLMEANGFPRRPGGLEMASNPGSSGIDKARLRLSGIRLRANACRLEERGMALDLGGVAKGVAADRAASAARAAGSADFLIDFGGMLVGRGTWSVGLRDPRGGADAAPLRVVPLPDGAAVATSGNYERFAVRPDGTRVGHVLDPRTGLPAGGSGGGDVLQVTVVTPCAALADAWSTALFVLGPDASRPIIERRRDIVPVWVLGAEASP